MARRYPNTLPVQASGLALLFLAAMLLILPLQWIGAALLAGLVHELAHAGAVWLCGGCIHRIRIGTGGAAMEIAPLDHARELFCALAGPVGGLLLFPLGQWLPRTALCAAIHSLYNLLPIYPLDGGRAIRNLTRLLFKQKTADRICKYIECIICFLLVLLGFYAVFIWRLGLLPALFTVLTLLHIRTVRQNPSDTLKFPCKEVEHKVQ